MFAAARAVKGRPVAASAGHRHRARTLLLLLFLLGRPFLFQGFGRFFFGLLLICLAFTHERCLLQWLELDGKAYKVSVIIVETQDRHDARGKARIPGFVGAPAGSACAHSTTSIRKRYSSHEEIALIWLRPRFCACTTTAGLPRPGACRGTNGRCLSIFMTNRGASGRWVRRGAWWLPPQPDGAARRCWRRHGSDLPDLPRRALGSAHAIGGTLAPRACIGIGCYETAAHRRDKSIKQGLPIWLEVHSH